MKTSMLQGTALALAGLMAPQASAQPVAPANAPASAAASDAAEGARIAANGAGGPVAACASCHGTRGEGNAAAGFPRLSGQSSWYLAKQLVNYTDASRNHPVMTPIAKGMTAAQRNAVSAYYASLDAPATKTTPATRSPGNGSNMASDGRNANNSGGAASAAALLQRGARLAGVGDESIAVQSCANCHGPGGVGEAPAYPYLAGQHASYLEATLTNWKSGARDTDPSKQMPNIAKRLSNTDIAAVAAYFSRQRPSSLAELQANQSSGTVAKPVPTTPVRSGPTGATPTQGVGTEQGSPTQGGSQGIGGGGAGPKRP